MATEAKAQSEDKPAAAAPPRPSERERAAAYLDLWERHLSQAAVHGCGPWPAARRPAG